MPGNEFLERLRRVFADVEFKAATGPGANTIEKLNTRIDIVTRSLA